MENINNFINMRSLIMDQVWAVYGPTHKPGMFSICFGKSTTYPSSLAARYTANIIMYTRPNSYDEWEFITGGGEEPTLHAAMWSLYMTLLTAFQNIKDNLPGNQIYKGRSVWPLADASGSLLFADKDSSEHEDPLMSGQS